MTYTTLCKVFISDPLLGEAKLPPSIPFPIRVELRTTLQLYRLQNSALAGIKAPLIIKNCQSNFPLRGTFTRGTEFTFITLFECYELYTPSFVQMENWPSPVHNLVAGLMWIDIFPLCNEFVLCFHYEWIR